MSGQLLSSKVVIVEEEPRIRGIPAGPTSIAGAVGITERGPIGKAVLCTSFEEFQTRFGGFTPDSELALAAMGFFENGGSQLWVVRTVHYTDIDDPATATAVRASGYLTTSSAASAAIVIGSTPGPFALTPGAQLVLAAGGPEQTITFQATAAAIAASGAGPFALTDGQTVRLRIDNAPEQEIIFAAASFLDIGNATTAELITTINEQILGGKAKLAGGVLTLVSDTAGTASRIEITGGTAATALGFPSGAITGSGNVATIRAVSIAEIKALTEAAVPAVLVEPASNGELGIRTVATGAAASLQIAATTAAAFGLDHDLHTGSDTGTANVLRIQGKDPGAYGNRIQVEVRPATSGDAAAFDLAVEHERGN